MADYVASGQQSLPFQNLPSQATPIKAEWLNGVEAALVDVAGSSGRVKALEQSGATTAPTAAFVGQTYRSAALVDLVVSTDIAQRPVALSTTGPWEGQALQEPSCWIANSKINCLFTAGSGLGYASCSVGADPTVAANWSRPASYSAPVITGAKHASTYVESGTVYCYYIDQATSGKVMLTTISTSADPTVAANWSTAVQVMSPPSGSSVFGNTRVVKDPGGTYYMLIEYKITSTGRWQIGQATAGSNSLSGTWTLITGAEIMTSLWPNSDRQGAGGAWLAKENGQWVMYYHASVNWNGLLPSDIYRATAPSLGSDNWTLTNGGRPIITRIASHEVDQVADIELIQTPDGIWYALWTGMHNRGTFVGKITCSRLMPALKQWSGTAWIAADLVPETVRPIRDPAKPRTIHKTTDFTSANSDGTTWDTVTDLSLTVAPSGTDMELEIRGVFSASGSAGFKYKFRAKQGSNTYPLGAMAGSTGNRGVFVGVAKLTQLTPGAFLGFSVEVLVPSGGGTINCRPAGFPGEEYAVFKASDIAYP
jgi:hypothetical protein